MMWDRHLKELKKVAERFRLVADDKDKITELVNETVETHPNDPEMRDLCGRILSAADGREVEDIVNGIRDRSF